MSSKWEKSKRTSGWRPRWRGRQLALGGVSEAVAVLRIGKTALGRGRAPSTKPICQLVCEPIWSAIQITAYHRAYGLRPDQDGAEDEARQPAYDEALGRALQSRPALDASPRPVPGQRLPSSENAACRKDD
jgi:hypothetical protein